MAKRKIIVLDADVIINFSKVQCLSRITSFLPNYDFIVLDKVYDELRDSLKNELRNNITHLKKIRKIEFPDGNVNILKEYATLIKTFGKGESACMSYCRFTDNVVGSSNFKDIRDYCNNNKILYIGTVDFLYYGIKNKIIEQKEAEDILKKMIEEGSKLPQGINFSNYNPTNIL